MTQPGRERAPQEVTPVRLAKATPGPLEGGAWPAATGVPPAPARPGSRGGIPPRDFAADLALDVRKVRQRALATAVYAGGAAVSLVAAGPHQPDFMLLPFAFCSLGTLVGGVWTAMTARRLREGGLGLREALGAGWREALARQQARGAMPRAAGGGATATATIVDDEVAASPHGAAHRRALDDRAAIADLIARLGPADRAMIPDVLPTVDALVRRVAELASSLHRLDLDVPAGRLAELDARVAEARQAPLETPDRERRLELLTRQRASLAELVQRRAQLAAKLESATLVIQNIRLDLLRLRSSGIESALDEFTSTAREAGTLTTEIGRALDVARELRARDP